MTSYRIKFEVDLVNPGSHTLSIGRKNGTMKLESEFTIDQLWDSKDGVSKQIAVDLTNQGLMVFSTPEIKSIKAVNRRAKRQPGVQQSQP